MIAIPIILLILAVVFIILAISSFRTARKRVNHIDLAGPLQHRLGGKSIEEVMGIWNIPQGEKYIFYLNERINEFIDDINRYNKEINYTQGIGYLIAFFVSIVSVIPLLLLYYWEG